MTTLYKWQIYCETSGQYEYIWDSSEPTTCPINAGHTVTSNSAFFTTFINKFYTTTATTCNTDGHNFYRLDTTSNNITLNLPPASTSVGRVIIIQKISGSNTVTIDANGADTVLSGATTTLTTNKQMLKIQPSGTNWVSLGLSTVTGEKYNLLEPSLLKDTFVSNDAKEYLGWENTCKQWTSRQMNVSDIEATLNHIVIGNGTSGMNEIKYNLAATTAPVATDDGPDGGYSVGSRWIDTTNDKEYVCLDATNNAAVWTETTGGGGGGSTLSSLTDVNIPLFEDRTAYATNHSFANWFRGEDISNVTTWPANQGGGSLIAGTGNAVQNVTTNTRQAMRINAGNHIQLDGVTVTDSSSTPLLFCTVLFNIDTPANQYLFSVNDDTAGATNEKLIWKFSGGVLQLEYKTIPDVLGGAAPTLTSGNVIIFTLWQDTAQNAKLYINDTLVVDSPTGNHLVGLRYFYFGKDVADAATGSKHIGMDILDTMIIDDMTDSNDVLPFIKSLQYYYAVLASNIDAVSGYFLQFNGTEWIDSAVSQALNDLSDVYIASANTGKILRYGTVDAVTGWHDQYPNFGMAALIGFNAIGGAPPSYASIETSTVLTYKSTDITDGGSNNITWSSIVGASDLVNPQTGGVVFTSNFGGASVNGIEIPNTGARAVFETPAIDLSSNSYVFSFGIDNFSTVGDSHIVTLSNANPPPTDSLTRTDTIVFKMNGSNTNGEFHYNGNSFGSVDTGSIQKGVLSIFILGSEIGAFFNGKLLGVGLLTGISSFTINFITFGGRADAAGDDSGINISDILVQQVGGTQLTFGTNSLASIWEKLYALVLRYDEIIYTGNANYVSLSPYTNLRANSVESYSSVVKTANTGLNYLTSGTTNTVTINTSSVYELVNLTTGVFGSYDMSRFQDNTLGRLTYNPIDDFAPRIFMVIFTLTVSVTGGGRAGRIALYKNGAIISGAEQAISIEATKQQFTGHWIERLIKGDYLEIYIRNDTDTTNLDVENNRIIATEIGVH